MAMQEEALLQRKKEHDLKMKIQQRKMKDMADEGPDFRDESLANGLEGIIGEDQATADMEKRDDILIPDDQEVSEISDLDDSNTKKGTGGAFKPIEALAEYNISTWMAVITASKYQTRPSWQEKDESTGVVKFLKKKAHLAFREDLLRFTKRMTWHYRWDETELQTVCFEEDPTRVYKDEDFVKFNESPEEFKEAKGGNHAHILCEYNGNRKRGVVGRVVVRLKQFFQSRGWNIHWSGVFDESLDRPLKHSRERSQAYLMVPSYM